MLKGRMEETPSTTLDAAFFARFSASLPMSAQDLSSPPPLPEDAARTPTGPLERGEVRVAPRETAAAAIGTATRDEEKAARRADSEAAWRE